MKSTFARSLTLILASALVMTGCTASLADLEQMRNDSLDQAEVMLPDLASELGGTLTEARGSFTRAGGGGWGFANNPTSYFNVRGEIAGPAPTFASLEQSLVRAGFTNIVVEEGYYDSPHPRAEATTPDGRMQINISYWDARTADGFYSPAGFSFGFRTVSTPQVAREDHTAANNDNARQFDQSLVHPIPE